VYVWITRDQVIDTEKVVAVVASDGDGAGTVIILEGGTAVHAHGSRETVVKRIRHGTIRDEMGVKKRGG
jgi:hypothetical protein